MAATVVQVPWAPQKPSAQVSLAAHAVGALHVKHPAAPIVQLISPLPSHCVAPAVHSSLHIVESSSPPPAEESSLAPSSTAVQPASPTATAIAANEPSRNRAREPATPTIC